MNFTQFAFWWMLLLVSIPLLSLRWLCQRYFRWPRGGDAWLLMLLSLTLFYSAARASFIIFVGELLFNYAMVRLMQRQSGKLASLIALVVILADLALLGYFKYLDFFVQSLLPTFASQETAVSQATAAIDHRGGIPPGISFYTFQMIAFVVDAFKSRDQKPLSLVDYINFAAFFPQVVAGPIERRADLLPQLHRFRFCFSLTNFEMGAGWLSLGLFMKLVLADNLALYLNLEEVNNPWLIWLGIVLFSWRIYFDFAGYSLIALGLARIIGVKLTLNFRAPYVAKNIQEFWQRWHVTLSGWFRDYLYIPLGGSKVPWVALNILIVFLISGLWHGAGWNFVIWGGYHGLLLVGHRYFGRYLGISRWMGWLCTLVSVMVSWLFFMETNLPRLMLKLQTLVNPLAYSLSNAKAAVHSFNLTERGALGLTVALTLMVLLLEHIAVLRQAADPYALLRSPWLTRGLVMALMLLTAQTSADFLYFEF